MASFVIEGGHRLSGEIHPQGAKNEVLQIICATLLTAEEVTVNNIPDILDVNNLIQLMREMGVTVAKEGVDTYSFKAENVDLAYLESDEFLKKCSSLRGSVMLIGPMVARFGKALISKPGGDKIGRRRLDTHFVGIQNLGADFRYDESRGIYEITADRLQGRYSQHSDGCRTGKRHYHHLQCRLRTLLAAALPYAQPDGSKDQRHRFQSAHHRGRGRTARHTAHRIARHDRSREFHRHGCHDQKRNYH